MDLMKDFAPFAYIAGAAGIAGLVWVAFDRLEKVANEELRLRVGVWLLSTSERFWVPTLEHINDLFNRFFGKNHLTWKCFFLSINISFFSFVLFGILILGIQGSLEFLGHPLLFLIQFGIILVINFFMDFLSLWESRLVLNQMTKAKGLWGIICWLFIDFLASSSIFYVPIFLGIAIDKPGHLLTYFFSLPFMGLKAFSVPLDGPYDFLMKTGYLTTYTTSYWIWVYVITASLSRFFTQAEKLKTIALWLDIDTQPIRAGGYIASAITFFISLVLALLFS